MIILEHCSRIS